MRNFKLKYKVSVWPYRNLPPLGINLLIFVFGRVADLEICQGGEAHDWRNWQPRMASIFLTSFNRARGEEHGPLTPHRSASAEASDSLSFVCYIIQVDETFCQ